MTLTKEQIREKYLRNEIFLIGESLGHGFEVIDRRANYIVVVDENGADKKMFLEEAYELSQKPAPVYVCRVCGVLQENHSAKHFYQPVLQEEYKPLEATRWTSLKERFEDPALSFKGYKTKNFHLIPEIQPVFEDIVEHSEDPYALLTAIKQLDIFLEKRDQNSFERAKNAISKVDSIENHPYLTEELITSDKPAAGLTLFKDFDLGEDFDFPIEEKLTYSGFKVALTEDFKNRAEEAMTHLESNPKELDSLAHHIKTISDIAHHYDHHHLKVGMSEEADISKVVKVSLIKASSSKDVFTVAKRAAVALIAQKLADKPLKKVSKKEKDVILGLIKKKKGVVFRLVKKLVPKIKHIENESLHQEVGTAE